MATVSITSLAWSRYGQGMDQGSGASKHRVLSVQRKFNLNISRIPWKVCNTRLTFDAKVGFSPRKVKTVLLSFDSKKLS